MYSWFLLCMSILPRWLQYLFAFVYSSFVHFGVWNTYTCTPIIGSHTNERKNKYMHGRDFGNTTASIYIGCITMIWFTTIKPLVFWMYLLNIFSYHESKSFTTIQVLTNLSFNPHWLYKSPESPNRNKQDLLGEIKINTYQGDVPWAKSPDCTYIPARD